MSEVMLFPLSSVVFPEGKMRLRIFEPRYKRLIADAMKGDGTFGICLFEHSSRPDVNELSTVGTLVKVTDFESIDGGMLGVTVTGIKRFAIHSVRVESDGLRFARVEWLLNWEVAQLDSFSTQLSLQLEKVYKQFPSVGTLYDQKFFDDACWVSQRWLEILPIGKREFDRIGLQLDHGVALNYLKERITLSPTDE